MADINEVRRTAERLRKAHADRGEHTHPFVLLVLQLDSAEPALPLHQWIQPCHVDGSMMHEVTDIVAVLRQTADKLEASLQAHHERKN